MHWWSVFFLVGAIVAAIIGFGEMVVGAQSIAKFFFWSFLILFFVSIIFYTYTIP